MDRTAAELFGRQHAVASTRQLLAIGWTHDDVARERRRRVIERIRLGVNRLVGSPRTWEQHVMATLLAVDGATYVAERTASQLLGLRLRIPPDNRTHLLMEGSQPRR